MNIILFGPPGAGKGTQGDILCKDFNLYKISTGDLLREEIKKKTLLGNKVKKIIEKGLFVSDNEINILIQNIISKKNYFNRLIFDGYPRNINQSKYLDSILKKFNQKISFVFNLNVNRNIVIKRISGRLLCSKCGLIFNEFYNPSSNENHQCGIKFLKKRPDDNEKTASNRFDKYVKETLPVLKYYQNQNLLNEIDGMSNITLIYKEIRRIIDSLET